MTFDRYYNELFRHDLQAVVLATPARPVADDAEFILQPHMLAADTPIIKVWNPERRALFAAALYLTILTDQVCQSYFPVQYPEFRERTMYPRLRAEHPEDPGKDMEPVDVFRLVAATPAPSRNEFFVDLTKLPPDWYDTMRREVAEFVSTDLGLDPDTFWSHCSDAMPSTLLAQRPAPKKKKGEEPA